MANDEMFEYMGRLSKDLEKMHIDLKSSLEKMHTDFTKKFDSLEMEVRKTNIAINNGLKPKIEGLLDCCNKNTEKLARVENKLDYVIKSNSN